MESKNNQFRAFEYFKALTDKNKMCKEHGFVCKECSGPEGIEGVLEEFKKTANFVLVDDTSSQTTFSKGVTFFDRNVYTVMVVMHYKFGDMADREEKMRMCRSIFRQFHARVMYDKLYGQDAELRAQLDFLDVMSVYSKEFPNYWMNGVTGLYFMMNNEEPVDLTFSTDEWDG